MSRTPRIAIIGGGIGGLAAALALEQRGAETIVCEQTGALSEIGAGLNLTPNAVKALRALGVEKQVQAIAAETDFLNIRSWKSGRYISRTKRGDFRQKFGAPNLSVHRADLLEVLATALKTTQFRFNARCIGVESNEQSAVVQLRRWQFDRSRHCRWRRRHSFGGAHCAVRRRRAAFHRLCLLARHGAGRSRAR